MARESMMPCWHGMSPCFPTLATARPNHVGLPEKGVRQICCRIGSGCLRTALPIVLVTPADNAAAQR